MDKRALILFLLLLASCKIYKVADDDCKIVEHLYVDGVPMAYCYDDDRTTYR